MEDKSTEKQPEQTKIEKPVTEAKTGGQPVTNGLAIAAMVVGIVSVTLGWVPFAGLTLGIAAIVLAIFGLKKHIGKGMSIAGIVTGGVAVLWNLVIIAALFTGLAILGGVASNVSNSISNYTQEQQAEINAQKDFAKGTTAKFDDFEVKVNLVTRNYVPDNEYSQASEGKELIVVNVTVKNVGTSSAYFSSYDLDINVNGISNSSSWETVVPEFEGGDMSVNATATGNIVYEVTKGATDLKLQYETTVYDSNNSEFKTLTYTLAI